MMRNLRRSFLDSNQMATAWTKVPFISEIFDTTRNARARPATEIEIQNGNIIFANIHDKLIFLLTQKCRLRIQSHRQGLKVSIRP